MVREIVFMQKRQFSFPLKTLFQDLREHFGLHLSRAKCMAMIVVGFLMLRTVNLWMVAQAFSGEAKLDSSRKRAKRFISQVSLCQAKVAKYAVGVMKLFSLGAWTLVMDRTNWQFGKRDINILYLSVAFKRVGIPLFSFYWRGNREGTRERKIGLIF